MKNIVLLSPIKSDAATLAASSQVSTLPVSYLQGIQPRRVWRSGGTTEYVTIDFGEDVACNSLALIRHNLTSAATLRMRGAASAAAVTAAPVVDTGALSAWPASGKPTAANWPSWFSWLEWSNATALRYWRLDIADAGNGAGYLEAGRLMAGVRWRPTLNFDFGGAPLGYAPTGKQVRTPYGSIFTGRRGLSPPRVLGVQLAAADHDEVLHGLAEMQRTRDLWGDLACVVDAEADADFHLYAMQGVFDASGGFNYPVVPMWNGARSMWGATIPLIELL